MMITIKADHNGNDNDKAHGNFGSDDNNDGMLINHEK